MKLISIYYLLISLHFLLVESTEGDEEPVEFTLLEFNSKNEVFQEQITFDEYSTKIMFWSLTFTLIKSTITGVMGAF